jgi:hypothetical protein
VILAALLMATTVVWAAADTSETGWAATTTRPHDAHGAVPAGPPGFTVFSGTGGPQTYVVPDNQCTVIAVVQGAQGGHVPGSASPSGRGGDVEGALTVIPGETLTIDVGTHGVDIGPLGIPGPVAGGWNGGGAGTIPFGASGGGATDIRRGTTLLMVAGGGGGAAITTGGGAAEGGAGGGTNGLDGSGATAGTGATQIAPGAGGVGTTPGSSGSAGTGGAGASGGGGGYFGGGGGAAEGGGGGGSALVPQGFSTVANAGPGGDGVAVIDPRGGECPAQPTVSPAPTVAPAVVVTPRLTG